MASLGRFRREAGSPELSLQTRRFVRDLSATTRRAAAPATRASRAGHRNARAGVSTAFGSPAPRLPVMRAFYQPD